MGNVVDMSIECWPWTKMSKVSAYIVIFRNVDFWRILVSRAYQTMTQKIVFFIFIALLNSIEKEEYLTQKRKRKTYLKVLFPLRFGTFQDFSCMSWHVLHLCLCCKTLRCCNIWNLQMSLTPYIIPFYLYSSCYSNALHYCFLRNNWYCLIQQNFLCHSWLGFYQNCYSQACYTSQLSPLSS